MKPERILIATTAAVLWLLNGPAPAADISLPPGFTASVFHPGLGKARHIVVRGNGDVYVALRRTLASPRIGSEASPGGLAALRDTDGDGTADVVERFGRSDVGTGIAIHKGHLYFSTDQAVYRVALDDGLVPDATPELIAGGFPVQRAHSAKPITFDGTGSMYVNSGAPSNACQTQTRQAGSAGLMPCPQLQRSGGIWRFDAERPWQDQLRDGEHFATGTRQIVALEYNPAVEQLYFVMHGRDQLDTLWPDYYSAAERAELPAEEFHAVEAGDDFGWPYTYYDPMRDARMRAPEYGGDGKATREEGFKKPLIAFPAHWGPNDLIFYAGENFPGRYRGGAFVAFHGSWNRAPLPQGGYKVAFVPLRDGAPAGEWEVFADGFAGVDPLRSPGDAEHRPTGLAQAPDGALYVTDSVGGRIWRISYSGG